MYIHYDAAFVFNFIISYNDFNLSQLIDPTIDIDARSRVFCTRHIRIRIRGHIILYYT